MNKRKTIILLLLALCALQGMAQKAFFNLTAREVQIDSLLPHFYHTVALGDDFEDSVYTAEILYPEFINMGDDDIRRFHELGGEAREGLPLVNCEVAVDRKKGVLYVDFMPIVVREGRMQKLVSFMLNVEGKAQKKSLRRQKAPMRASAAGRYAEHSVLATGKWAKIRVPQSGIYQITDALIRQCGFSDLRKVKVYGYGGALQNEKLVASELVALDDLKEVATYDAGSYRLFHAQGPVSWESNSTTKRVRNPYATHGYYFLTEDDGEPLMVDSTTFIGASYPLPEAYHVLHEQEQFSWYDGGRNLFESEQLALGTTKTYKLANPGGAQRGTLTVAMSAAALSVDKRSRATVAVNGETVGNVVVNYVSYDRADLGTANFTVTNLQDENTITVTPVEGNIMRTDYIQMTYDTPAPLPPLKSGKFPTAEYVYNITNQDLHGHGACDMVIIIPTSQKLRAQAERLKAFHEEHDGLRVNLVPADEIFNEFSSGTPDANAYRRYMKMLYDRAESEADQPKSLLLFGDCAWDNRMVSDVWKTYSPDDFLLCFESENSWSETKCYVDDGFFCLLDDGEGTSLLTRDLPDVGVGRFPVRTAEEAKVMVDKTINYMTNLNAGSWQNTLMFMGDDGNNNDHMRDVNAVATLVEEINPSMLVKKVYWDAYTRETTSTGNSYPVPMALIKQQQQNGALVMDYAGHAAANAMSHEQVLVLDDFRSFVNTNLPIWVTACCDIMPFDGQKENIGEAAVLNDKGGAVAFFGTSRTVFIDPNFAINRAFLKALFTKSDGKYPTIGEAQRQAKHSMLANRGKYINVDGKDRHIGDGTENKLQYQLMGDPALRLNIPDETIVVDEINGQPVSATALAQLKAGQQATVKGHVEGGDDFNGIVALTVRDAQEFITCKLQDTDRNSGASEAFTFYDRNKIIYAGSDSIRNGQFKFTFAVPIDISYADATGMMNLFAVNTDKTRLANGFCGDFLVGGTDVAANDSIGPSIHCYLNTPDFSNGGNVNLTPYFVAQLNDKDGLNTTGTGIGHDLELTIDGDTEKTYVLNEYFQYDFGTYTSGTTYFQIPALAEGPHTLKFRAWDILNNPSTATLQFNVVRNLEPNLAEVSVTQNPARTATTFIVSHNRTGSNIEVDIEVFDLSGRLLWRHSDSGTATTGTYTYNWNLTTETGAQLQTGVYLYRVRLGSDGSSKASKAKRLVVIRN